MFCSTIIPTVGRPTLSRSVQSVLDQAFAVDDFEIIVVNDLGAPLPEADWQKSERVRIIDTNQRERSVARNTGAAIARGRYLHFLDDDDWLLPGAFAHLWELAQSNQAVWLYGGYNFVDGKGRILEEWHPDENGNCLVRLVASEWLPLQASFIKSEAFFAVGGFNPSLILFEDSNLAQRIALQGQITGTPALVASIVRNEEDSTTDYTELRERSHWSREEILSTSSAFNRMRNSAMSRTVNVAYWHGRVTAAYLGSIIWNLRQRRMTTVISRGFYGLASIFLSGRYALSLNFWRGATTPHITRGFLVRNGVQ